MNLYRRYEIPLIILPEIQSQILSGFAKKIVQFIRNNGGAIVKSEYVGIRDLAYRIKKSDKGRYYILDISLKPSNVKELDAMFKFSGFVLRHMIILNEGKALGVSTISNRSSQTSDDQEFVEIFNTAS
jgi:small subunit ribosomal protein S6